MTNVCSEPLFTPRRDTDIKLREKTLKMRVWLARVKSSQNKQGRRGADEWDAGGKKGCFSCDT